MASMNELEKQLSYPHGDTLPALGETIEVAPGVKWLRMRLPFALDHINLWLLKDRIDGRDGWTVVDCGVSNDETRAAWEQIFQTQLEGLPILRVMVTHMHPDHIGLSQWLTERWSQEHAPCRLWISATDFAMARLAISGDFPANGPKAARFFAAHGLTDPEAQEKIRQRGNYFSNMVPGLPESYRRMMEGLAIEIGGRTWRCHAGYGHAPEHISLECPELHVLISGDMVLPRISTNISISTLEPEANALQLYVDSLERMRALPADTLVLPAHGRPFKGLHTRVDQLQQHHVDRLADVWNACRDTAGSAADMLEVLFKRKLDLHQTTFAMGEAVAHLNSLWLDGRMTREQGDDGIYRFRSVGASSAG
jgi:glyoxylase-like metal-dependent hydrolase (beta-lactamase superfamily II)